jgi:SAM-dependent methyltransferase
MGNVEKTQDGYATWAEHYDAIYHWKPYPDEAQQIRALLNAQGVADNARVLEAACGTGAHMIYLQEWFTMEGFDISDSMLRVARRRLPKANLFQADMSKFTVAEPYDAVLSLFSSIGYVHTEEALGQTASCFAKAIKPGGCLLIEPWIGPDDFKPGMPTQHTYESDDLKLCRSVVSRQEGEMAVLDFHWLVTPRGGQVEHFVDRHELWLCPRDTMLRVFRDAGFDAQWQTDGLMRDRELLVAKRK